MLYPRVSLYALMLAAAGIPLYIHLPRFAAVNLGIGLGVIGTILLLIRLVDLGGLISRTIAKNMDDKAFLTAYLLEDIRPDFVFGSRNFAAASGFAETAAFAREYVRLEFADMPAMPSALSYVRRDLIDPASDLELVYDTSGALQRVLVFGQW